MSTKKRLTKLPSTNILERIFPIIAILGISSGVFSFLIVFMTGNAIASNIYASNAVCASLILIGLIGELFYFKNNSSN